MRPERKWLVDSSSSPDDAKRYWEEEHHDNDYATTFSVGEDEGVTRAVLDAVLSAESCRRVLVAGCGSRTELQEALLRAAPGDTEVVATDFAAVVELAERRFSHPRLTYRSLEDRGRLASRFDVVVAVNVLVKGRDAENRELIDEWAGCLEEDGALVSLSPVLYCGLELAMLSGRDDLSGCLDLEGSAWLEPYQGVRQVEYSPLRLRRILREAGLRICDLRLVFLEGHSSREQTRLHYGLEDEDLIVYEQLVVAKRF